MNDPLPPSSDNLLVALIAFWAILSFYFVSGVVYRQARAGRLLGNENAPPRFALPPLLGWSMVLGPLVLILAQSFYFYLAAPMIVAAAGENVASRFGWTRLSLGRLLRDTTLICGAFVFIMTPLNILSKIGVDYFHWPDQEQDSVQFFQQLVQSRDVKAVLVFLLQAVVLAPFMEELFFRGFLFTFFKNYFSTGSAILLSGAIFGLVHLNLASFFPLWAFGVVLALTYEVTGSLLLCMLIHAGFNLGTALVLLLTKT